MKRFMAGIVTIDKSLYVIAGIVLAFMIVLTFFDVILRNLGHPITGSMEFIQYGGSIVFGFSIPLRHIARGPGNCRYHNGEA